MTSDAENTVVSTESGSQTVDSLERTYRAVIYCRVSTEDHRQTNKTQERECRSYCESQGIEVLEVYKDEETGTSPYREDFGKMMLRIQLQEDVDYIVAYDQSRITRGDDIKKLMALIGTHRCSFRFVMNDFDDSTIGGRIARGVISEINAEENRVRNSKTKLGMETRRREGKHLGRPASFMFAEDIEKAPKGRFKEGKTKVVTTEYMLSFARQGMTINYVATHILAVDPHCVVHEMRLADPDDPKCRDKGMVDRYTEYMTLYTEAKRAGKGSDGERVENKPENDGERVVA